jgi:hypothetical protein
VLFDDIIRDRVHENNVIKSASYVCEKNKLGLRIETLKAAPEAFVTQQKSAGREHKHNLNIS